NCIGNDGCVGAGVGVTVTAGLSMLTAGAPGVKLRSPTFMLSDVGGKVGTAGATVWLAARMGKVGVSGIGVSVSQPNRKSANKRMAIRCPFTRKRIKGS